MNSVNGSEDSFDDEGLILSDLDIYPGVQFARDDVEHIRNGLDSGSRWLRNCKKLPVDAQPLRDGDLRYELEHGVSDGGVCRTLERVGKSISSKNSTPEETPLTEKTAEFSSSNPECTTFAGVPVPAQQQPIVERPNNRGNAVNLILGREAGLGRTNKWTLSQKRSVLCPLQLPTWPKRVVAKMPGHAYTANFSEDGELFVAGFQDQKIIVYKPDANWEIQKRITAQQLHWTITDTCLSHDARFLLYSTISPVLHVVKLRGEGSVMDSQANITELHDPIYLGENGFDSFGIWSMAWSRDNREIIVGTNTDANEILLYDMQQQCTTASVPGHTLDVNSVAFMDESCQVFVSGSDDTSIKLWDRRILGDRTSPVGTLVGHLEGITHIDTKGDGRHLISNCKDQTIKLWDIRGNLATEEAATSYRHLKNQRLPHFLWDYRWNEYPGDGYLLEHPRDASLMTFRGHSVLQTLIRAYFSPQFTTGQRYIYTGCRYGTMRIYDILTGETVHELCLHRYVVRDCAWHPYEPLLVSTSWDGHIVEWAPKSN